jgi:hypothetical protein
MEQRLLLHRINVLADRAAIDESVKRPTPILAYPTDPPVTVKDHTAMGAQVAAHLVVAQFFVQQCLSRFHLYHLQAV